MWPFKKRKNEAKARDEPQRSRRMPNLRWINRPRADNTIQGNEAIYAAVSRIANTVASLPMHIYKDYMLVPEHPMERLLNLEPNPNFTAFGFRQTMEVLRNTEGNAYALKIPDGLGGVKRLDILNPTRVESEVGTYGKVLEFPKRRKRAGGRRAGRARGAGGR